MLRDYCNLYPIGLYRRYGLRYPRTPHPGSDPGDLPWTAEDSKMQSLSLAVYRGLITAKLTVTGKAVQLEMDGATAHGFSPLDPGTSAPGALQDTFRGGRNVRRSWLGPINAGDV